MEYGLITMNPMKIKIAIVDNEEWISFLTNKVLQQCDDIEIVWSESTSMNTLLKANTRRVIDIIVADLNHIEKWFGGFDILFGIKEIKKVKVITLTREFNEAAVLKSFTAGAMNCLPKAKFNQIPESIRTAYYQETRPLDILIRDYRRLKIFEMKANLFGRLTDHQKEVIELYIQGYQVPDIARLMGIKIQPTAMVIQRSAKLLGLEHKTTGKKGYRNEILKKLSLGIMDEKVKVLAPAKSRPKKPQSNPGLFWEMDRKIRIGIIDLPEWLGAISDIIRQYEDIKISWQVINLTEVFQKINTVTVDLILIDLGLIKKWYGGYDIIHGIAKLKNIKVIVLTPNGAKDSILKSFIAGAMNYLPKSNLNQLPDTIRMTYHNEDPLLMTLINDYRRLWIFEAKEKLFIGLTPYQKEAMNLYITNKYLVKEIAALLHKPTYTIDMLVNRSVRTMNLVLRQFRNRGPGRGYQNQILKKIGLGIIDEDELKKRLNLLNGNELKITPYVKLTGVGAFPAIPAKELQVGDRFIRNYGYIYIVLQAIPNKSGKSITFVVEKETKREKGKEHKRNFLNDTLIAKLGLEEMKEADK
jgi:DNA-binding NarL/FixJ family response regulator